MSETTLLIGTLVLVAMVYATTNKQLDKMKRLERLFQQQEKSGLSILDFCEKHDINRSTFYYWKQRYEEHAAKGLIDKRKGVPYKAAKDKRKYILETKLKNPLMSSRDIAEKFERRFRMRITARRVSQILREEDLNDPVGRKTGKPIKKTRT